MYFRVWLSGMTKRVCVSMFFFSGIQFSFLILSKRTCAKKKQKSFVVTVLLQNLSLFAQYVYDVERGFLLITLWSLVFPLDLECVPCPPTLFESKLKRVFQFRLKINAETEESNSRTMSTWKSDGSLGNVLNSLIALRPSIYAALSTEGSVWESSFPEIFSHGECRYENEFVRDLVEGESHVPLMLIEGHWVRFFVSSL